MKKTDLLIKDYIYMTEVSDSKEKEDFEIELYPLGSDLKCADSPIRVIHNFDELIDFFEEEEG
ncbi:hypothetical protein [Robertmurraya massiliosenegalensis]|uniref:hypothetical protein n=1 Tax=Robertmurraya massiliosenegalensis TaxID=1287657 RepID=UPI0002FE64B2|nr:hypothetical protein [Robertmurraya massiliosenegalensis]